MNDASAPRPRLHVLAAALLAASSFASSFAIAADDEPVYFSERFGGVIDRVTVGPDGSIYVAGRTPAPDLPASTSAPEPGTDYEGPRWLYFAAALDADGQPRWTSYLLGEARDYRGAVNGLAVAPDGSVWIAGLGLVESAPGFQPEVGGWYDAVVAKFGADGTVLFATNVGGAGLDEATGLAVLPDGDAVVVGSTGSDDFPYAPLPEGGPKWTTDAFVMRIRADGSGPVWTQRFGNDFDSSRLDAGSVAVDPADGTILVTMAGEPNQARSPFATELRPPRSDLPSRSFRGMRNPMVLRFDSDGRQTEGAHLSGLQANWGVTPLPVALAADGDVLVGGTAGVARLASPLFIGITDAWIHGWRRWGSTVVQRIATDADGRVVMLVNGGDYYNPWTRILVRDATLEFEETQADRVTELGMLPNDIAVAADGSLIVVGQGAGASFRAAYDAAGAATGCIARVPLDGVRAPTRLRARAAGTRAAEVAWSRDGDRAEAFEIEDVPSGAAPVVLARVEGDASRHRVTGLTPGEKYDLRVVAVFAHGVRSASPVRGVVLPPEAPIDVVAEDGPGQRVSVLLHDPNGSSTIWRVQRRFGDGPWMETGLYGQWPAPSRGVGEWLVQPSALDVVPDVAVPVTYRVFGLAGERRSAWTESAPFVPQATMRVTQTSGHLGVVTPQGVELAMTGTLAASGATPLSFDPEKDEFRLLYGPASAPAEFVLPPGYPGWSSDGGVHTWNAADSLTAWEDGSEIVLDLAHGEFTVRLLATYGSEVPTTQVAVNLAFGAFSGGDVKPWRGRTGWGEILQFGETPDANAGARAR